MIKKVLLALALTVSMISFANANTLKEAGDATFKLYEGERGICSTTFVGNDANGAIFLTANHCIEDPTSTVMNVREQKKNDKFEVIGENIHYLKVLRTSSEDDTALLGSADKDFAPKIAAAEVAKADDERSLEFGKELIVLGFPAAEEKSITKGNFTAKIKGVLDVKEEYQTTVPVAGGNSGGGLWAQFGDEWKLIGVTQAKRRDNDIMTYFSTIAAANRAMSGFLGNKTPTPIKKDQLSNGKTDEK